MGTENATVFGTGLAIIESVLLTVTVLLPTALLTGVTASSASVPQKEPTTPIAGTSITASPGFRSVMLGTP